MFNPRTKSCLYNRSLSYTTAKLDDEFTLICSAKLFDLEHAGATRFGNFLIDREHFDPTNRPSTFFNESSRNDGTTFVYKDDCIWCES